MTGEAAMSQPPSENQDNITGASDEAELEHSEGETPPTAEQEEEKYQKYSKAITEVFNKYYQPGIERCMCPEECGLWVVPIAVRLPLPRGSGSAR
jgi:hypothetical protein